MSRHWVVDASPIILLAKTGRLDLLSACADEVLIPAAVAEEVKQADASDPARAWIEDKGQDVIEATAPVAPTVAA